MLLAAFAVGGCDDLETIDESATFNDESSLTFEEENAAEIDFALTSEEIDAVQRERRIASLPTVGGRIDIVDAGTEGEAAFVYVSVGGPLLDELLAELVEQQGATPAEVFLSLADDATELPPSLLEDHLARVEEGLATRGTPERLHYVAPRTLENEHHGCYGSGTSAQSFSSWVEEWDAQFSYEYTRDGYEYQHRNTADGVEMYTVGGDIDGRVLSACNASDNDSAVSYWIYNTGAGPDFLPFWADSIDRFDAVHFYTVGWGLPYKMAVSHTHPSPDTYVAVGRCGNNC